MTEGVDVYDYAIKNNLVKAEGELKGFSRQRAHQLIKKIIENHRNM